MSDEDAYAMGWKEATNHAMVLLTELAKECVYAKDAGSAEGPQHQKLLLKLGEVMGALYKAKEDPQRPLAQESPEAATMSENTCKGPAA